MWDLIILGGGAAGLWAAGTAASLGVRTLVLEKNKKPGVKILMSGGTRCNLTHNCGIDGILSAFGNQGRFLKPALHVLSPQQIISSFNQLGVATKIEDSGKVFPVSDRAIDVRDALVHRLLSHGATLACGEAVNQVRPAGNQENTWEITTIKANYQSRFVLVCCGGLSFPGCGTTGDGYAWASAMGHTVVPTCPALTPLLSSAEWVHSLTGITQNDVLVRVQIDGSKEKDPRMSSRGGFLWTHFGCSGPAPMNVSRFVSQLSPGQQASLVVDLVPNLSEVELQNLFSPDRQARRQIQSQLQSFVPRKLAERLMFRAHIAEGVTLAELPRKGRQSLLEDLKRLPIPICGTRGYAKAEVTRGGVKTQEVNPQTMESRCVSGLYLAGEILDIDGPIGGFNFQAAFSTGHLAAHNIAKALKASSITD
ncbi:MAG: aminoacetone oxidase family FAD-binding enzyme [Planctomycetales bacterium]|nr:aminoacetone oxidase family FAD-binding enzyme [Planctomycetales bacterium]